MDYYNQANFEELKGKTVVKITGMEEGGADIYFTLDDGTKYHMYHSQNCCENVYIESVVGDINNLIGESLLVAEVSTSEDAPEGVKTPEYADYSTTWTFYKLATRKGYVDIRWFGSSNGYYSESVDFERVA